MSLDNVDLASAVVVGCEDHLVQSGSCAKCGMAIRYAVIIRLPNGSTYEIGEECAEKVGDAMSDYVKARVEARKAAAKKAREDGRFEIVHRYHKTTLLRCRGKCYEIGKSVARVFEIRDVCNHDAPGRHPEPCWKFWGVYYSGIHGEYFVIPSDAKFTKPLADVWKPGMVLMPPSDGNYGLSLAEMTELLDSGKAPAM